MAVQIQPLFEPVQLASAPTSYFTALVNTRIDKMTLTNVDAAVHMATLYWVPAGATPGAANIIVDAQRIGASKSWDAWYFIGHVLGVGDTIQAMADAAAVLNFFASGTALN